MNKNLVVSCHGCGDSIFLENVVMGEKMIFKCKSCGFDHEVTYEIDFSEDN